MSTLFEAHNARFADLKTVGSTFVLRKEAFKTICRGNNTLLLGPRGSGKTTLFKMMKIGAQVASESAENYQTLKGIDFYPVYLSADRQFELLTGGIDSSKESNAAFLGPISKTLTAIRTQFALLDTLEEMRNPRTENNKKVSHLFVTISRRSEFDLCKLLQNSWNIDEDIGTIKELRSHLSKRIDNINSAVYSFTIFPDDRSHVLAISRYFTDPISISEAFIRSFDDTFPERKKRWCLCVDELEIMPESLQKYFFLSLRSTDSSLVLKVATSPFTQAFSEFYNPTAKTPSDGNDYDSVNLSDPHKSGTMRFTRKLVGELLHRHKLPGSVNPITILGKSPITDENNSKQDSAYAAPDGAHYKRFDKLSSIDPSFKAFLRLRQVNLSSVDALTEGTRAASVRQAIWQVALRLEFGAHQEFKSKSGKLMRQPPKKRISDVYTGSTAILTMCEGNPRITIGLFNVLISEFIRLGKKKVPLETQAALVETTIAKYLSLLSAIPIELPGMKNKASSIVTLLGRVAKYCENNNITGNFKPEALSTIRINDDSHPALIEALGNAINQGAFVMIEDAEKQKSYGDLRGARLRLSYLLCPKYKLPLTYGRTVLLNDAISGKSVYRNENALRVRDLFINED